MTQIPRSRYSEYLQQSKELDRFYHEAALSMGLSDSCFSLLYALCERGEPTSPKDLYAEWSRSKQTGHSALAALERQGLLLLSPDPRDRRGKLVTLTAEGDAFVRRAIAPLLAAERASFARLSGADQGQLIALTGKSLRLLKEEWAGALSAGQEKL